MLDSMKRQLKVSDKLIGIGLFLEGGTNRIAQLAVFKSV